MSESSRDEDADVLGKLDALLKRHQPASDVDFPVLTDMIESPEIDLDAIPMLTEEIDSQPITPAAEVEASDLSMPEPALEPEIPEHSAPTSEIELPALEFEIPPEIQYVSLEAAVPVEPKLTETVLAGPISPAPAQAEPAPLQQALSEEAIQHIANIIKDDVAQILDTHLQQALAQQLQSSLHVALDRALSSMLDQFTTTIEEVVRVSIADELQKQLAPFKRPAPPKS